MTHGELGATPHSESSLEENMGEGHGHSGQQSVLTGAMTAMSFETLEGGGPKQRHTACKHVQRAGNRSRDWRRRIFDAENSECGRNTCCGWRETRRVTDQRDVLT